MLLSEVQQLLDSEQQLWRDELLCLRCLLVTQIEMWQRVGYVGLEFGEISLVLCDDLER